MTVMVTKYYARWAPMKHTGYIMIYWNGGSKVFAEGCFTNPTEFQIVIDLLRNEKPVWWDEATGRLFVSGEPTGENE